MGWRTRLLSVQGPCLPAILLKPPNTHPSSPAPRPQSCNSLVLSWLGYLPVLFLLAAAALSNAWLMSPKRPADTGILQSWLEEFAWTEAELPQRREERVSTLVSVASSSGDKPAERAKLAEKLHNEPMFCVEVSLMRCRVQTV